MRKPRSPYLKLARLIEDEGFEHREFAKLVGMGESTLSTRLNPKPEQKNNEWRHYEITAICRELHIPQEQIGEYEYGHPYSKKTLLWERGVPPLHPTNIVEPTATWCPSGSYSHKHGEQHKGMFTTDRARNRAKTFPGVAKAMSEQWG